MTELLKYPVLCVVASVLFVAFVRHGLGSYRYPYEEEYDEIALDELNKDKQ